MICLENRTFAVSQTTLASNVICPLPLWFAWKIVLLQYRKQLSAGIICFWHCCDLLGKSYFCSIANNNFLVYLCITIVVICLENRTFAVSQTTSPSCLTKATGCDLLGKSYFCSIANNCAAILSEWWLVVICLENRTFAVSQTTVRSTRGTLRGCDLLGKSYFCSIANNKPFD